MSWAGNGWHSPPRYLQQVSDPRAFVPVWQQHSPSVWYNPDAYHASAPPSPSGATQASSKKYPKLNPVLAEDTTLLRFDVKIPPSSSILTSTYITNRNQLALATPTQRMRIISKAFPWQIDILSHSSVTCEDVWNSVYTALQQPIADSEWGFIVREKDAKERIEKSMKKRLDADKLADKHPKRVDYLGDVTLFRGLEKDEEFVKLRLLPHSTKCEETWVIKLMA